MFSLIISVISIALVTALTVATIYYIGPAVKASAKQAQAAEFMNIGETIRAAINIYKIDNTGNGPGEGTAGIQTLIDAKLIKELPDTWTITNNNVTQSDVDEITCQQVNNYLYGEKTVYACSEMVAGQSGCCDTTL